MDRELHGNRRALVADQENYSLAQIPVGVGVGLLLPATIMYLVEPGSHPSPGFHLFGGATILCAFFIATDPVSAATSPRGRLIFGAGIGFLIYAIRRWCRVRCPDYEHCRTRDRLHDTAAHCWA